MADLENKSGEVAASYIAGLQAADVENRTLVFDAEECAGKVPVALLNPGQQLTVLDEVIAMWHSQQPAPQRRKGISKLFDLESFLAYLERMKGPNSVVWANPKVFALQAQFDYHPAGPDHTQAAWGEHGADYTCPRSPEWTFWTQGDGRDFSQDEFAQLVEDHFEEIRGGDGFPASTELLEMARDLRIHSKGTFERKVDPVTGQFAMVAKEEHETTSTKIHRAFRLGLRVFDGGDVYAVEARVRFRIHNGKPTFSYALYRRVEIERDAFNAVVTKVREKLPVFLGESDI